MALLAALGALVCICTRSQLDTIPALLPISFVAAGILALFGSNVRWRATPWLVALNTVIVYAGVLAPSTYFGILLPAFDDVHARPVGWILSFIAAAMTGLVTDEWMASAQTLLRLGFNGRRVRRSFLGLSPIRSRRP